jgi:hypothetical protein
MDRKHIINITPQKIQDAPTIQREESQVMHEKHNTLNESICEEDVLPSQEINHQVSTDFRELSSHTFSSVTDDPREGIRTKFKMSKMIVHCAFISQLEHKIFEDVNNDSHWICVMQDELNQFERN